MAFIFRFFFFFFLFFSSLQNIISKLEKNEEKDNDLQFTLLKSQYDSEDIRKMTDQQLRDEVMTIFLAGYETTANALGYFYLLSEHPAIDARLQKEIYSLFDNKTNILFDDIQELEYTTKILTESMRLYPSAYALGRQAIYDSNKLGLDHYAINLPSQNDLILLNCLLEFKIDIDEKLTENDNQFSSSFYVYDFDGIKIQFLYNDH